MVSTHPSAPFESPVLERMSTLRRNLLATYASQIYVALIGIVIVPVYIRYMGAESYGLVGFYAMLQAWFQLLDFGLAPTLSRETARLAGGAQDALTLRRLLRVLEGVFIAVALAGALLMVAGSNWVAMHWLNAQALPVEQVRSAVELMAGIIGLRWVAGLYRGAVGGFEQQVWLGWLNAWVATARFVAILLIFEWVGTTPAHFFGWQLIVAAVETLLLAQKTYRLLPVRTVGEPPVGWHWGALSGIVGFSLRIAFSSAVWVGVTQTDKLVLSKILPLAEYGHFTLAVLAASGVSIVSGPLSAALLPRLARLQAQGDETGVIRLYRSATQGMAAIALPVAAVLGFCAGPLLHAWTGNAQLAAQTTPVLTLYALGNGVLALSAFPYYLQFAKGDVKLHLIGNVIFVLLLIPSIIVAAMHHGAVGAGWAWLAANLIYLVFWVPLVHRRLAPGLHRRWLLEDLAPPALISVAVAIILTAAWPWSNSRLADFLGLCVIGLVTFTGATLGSGRGRTAVIERLRD